MSRKVTMSVAIKLSRPTRSYSPDEPLEGKIIIKLSSSISHYGLRLNLIGSVNLQILGGSAGLLESVVGVLKPITFLSRSFEIRPSGKISSGTSEIPFSVMLRQQEDKRTGKFYETFHGGNINIQYLLTVGIARGYLHKALSTTLEVIIESETSELLELPISPELVLFCITQDTQRHPLLSELKSGGFRVSGKIPTQCSLSCPFQGEMVVDSSALPIQSIDMHLMRVESILVGDKIVSETSIIQTTQIADGDVCRGLVLPIYVLLPRLLTCPTVLAGPFAVEFKMSITISFQSDLSKSQPKSDPRTPRLWVAMETLPLELVRTR